MILRFTELLPTMMIIQHSNWMLTLFICQIPYFKSKEVLLLVYFTEANPLNTATLFDSRALTACSSLELGLLITTDFMWSTHIANICTKTRKLILGIIWYCTDDFTSTPLVPHCSNCTSLAFIRPHVEYAAVAWDPFLRKDIDLIEDVQKYALKVCLKSWSANYSELLEQSHLPTLQARIEGVKLNFAIYIKLSTKKLFSWTPRTLSYPSLFIARGKRVWWNAYSLLVPRGKISPDCRMVHVIKKRLRCSTVHFALY